VTLVRPHRLLATSGQRVDRALLDPAARAKWLPPHGFTGRVHESDLRVGGGYRMSLTDFGTGSSHCFGGADPELLPGERIRPTNRFDDPGLPGAMEVPVGLSTVSYGTGLAITPRGIAAVIPLEACDLGWQESRAQLALLVETDVPDDA